MKLFKAFFVLLILLKLLGLGSDTNFKRDFFKFFFLSDVNLFAHLEIYKRSILSAQFVDSSGDVLWEPKSIHFYGVGKDLSYLSFFDGLAKAESIPDDFLPYWKNEKSLGATSIKMLGFKFSFENRFWIRERILQDFRTKCVGPHLSISAKVAFKELNNKITSYHKFLENVDCE